MSTKKLSFYEILSEYLIKPNSKKVIDSNYKLFDKDFIPKFKDCTEEQILSIRELVLQIVVIPNRFYDHYSKTICFYRSYLKWESDVFVKSAARFPTNPYSFLAVEELKRRDLLTKEIKEENKANSGLKAKILKLHPPRIYE